MELKIFDIEEGNVKINANALLIPELKAIVDRYEDPLPPLAFVHFMTNPFGPYSNLVETQREEILLNDYPGDYTTEDEEIQLALKKCFELYETPSMRLLRKAKVGLQTLGDYLESASIRDDSRDGNLGHFNTALKNIGKINQEYQSLERQVVEELKVRGNNQLGYDEV